LAAIPNFSGNCFTMPSARGVRHVQDVVVHGVEGAHVAIPILRQTRDDFVRGGREVLLHHVLERRTRPVRIGFAQERRNLDAVLLPLNHIVGLILSDTDATSNRRRVFIGHDKGGVASVSLMDRDGRKRILLQVAPEGTPSLSFLDADGKVVNQIGPQRSE